MQKKIYKKYGLAIFCLFLLTNTFGDWQNDFFIGKYHLYLSPAGDGGFQQSYIEIKSLSNNTVRGVVGLDFNIGPQGRMPMPWEKLHELPFKGKYDSNSGKVTISVTVILNLQTVRYTFQGYFMSMKSSNITGFYYIDQQEKGGFLAKK